MQYFYRPGIPAPPLTNKVCSSRRRESVKAAMGLAIILVSQAVVECQTWMVLEERARRAPLGRMRSWRASKPIGYLLLNYVKVFLTLKSTSTAASHGY